MSLLRRVKWVACCALLTAGMAQAGVREGEEVELLAPGEAAPQSQESAGPDWLTLERWYALRLTARHPDWLLPALQQRLKLLLAVQ